MAFIVANTGAQIKAKFDGALFNWALSGLDFILDGIGSNFEMMYQGGSLSVSVGTGHALIGGRHFVAEEMNTIDLEANSTIYLCLRVDLTQLEGQEGMLYANTSADIADDDLNNTNGQRDMLIAVITTDGTGITNLVDKRPIRKKDGITRATLEAGETTITINDPQITTNSDISFWSEGDTDLYPSSRTVSAGKIVLEYDAQDEDVVIGIKVEG